MALTTVLLDLDGVVRHFDPDRGESIERRHGLATGVLSATAFESDLIGRVVTGRMHRVDWVEEIGERVGSPAAARECFSGHGVVDERMLAEVDWLRSGGVVVAVLTNGTDTIPAEMTDLGLDVRFDAIFNSAELGVAKPDRRVFELVCSHLQVDPRQVFFTDDSAGNLRGAIEIGMTARRFEDVDTFRRHLTEAGFAVAP
ncbi:MAG: HAD family hydrolase [Actinomycetota bacterium]